MTTLDWTIHNRIRSVVEKYWLKQSTQDNLNLPMYDLFVTELRKDYEQAGFDFTDERDLFRAWGMLQLTCAAGAHVVMEECKTKEAMAAAVHTWGVYGNMTGLFLREMSKHFNLPAIEEAPNE